MFHEFIYEFGCTKAPDGAAAKRDAYFCIFFQIPGTANPKCPPVGPVRQLRLGCHYVVYNHI